MIPLIASLYKSSIVVQSAAKYRSVLFPAHDRSVRLLITPVFGVQDTLQSGHKIGNTATCEGVIHRCTLLAILEDAGVL